MSDTYNDAYLLQREIEQVEAQMWRIHADDIDEMIEYQERLAKLRERLEFILRDQDFLMLGVSHDW